MKAFSTIVTSIPSLRRPARQRGSMAHLLLLRRSFWAPLENGPHARGHRRNSYMQRTSNFGATVGVTFALMLAGAGFDACAEGVDKDSPGDQDASFPATTVGGLGGTDST